MKLSAVAERDCRPAGALELMIELLPAELTRLSEVRDLLLRAGLPTEGIEEQFPSGFVLAERQGELVGVTGLERYDDLGLLRSVVVAEQCRRSGVGRRLVRNRLDAAAAAGIRRVFLLTTTAGTYFERLGFVPAQRADVPPPLALSVEFAHACPASAICLAYEVSRGSDAGGRAERIRLQIRS